MSGSPGRPAAFAAEHARLLHDSRFQFDWAPSTPPDPPPAWLLPLMKVIAPVLPYVFWAAVIGGAGFLLLLFVQGVLRSRGDGGRATVLAGAEPVLAAGRAQVRLAQADALAAEGRFGDAVRLLLFRTLDDIEERRPGLIAASLTSREIARLQALPEPARPALAHIASAVERVVFAGRGADAALFRACREDYVRFARGVAGAVA